jgi:hypothetical protein
MLNPLGLTISLANLAGVFMPKKFLKNSKIIVDLVPQGDYIIYNKRETKGQTSAQRRGTK